MSEVCGLNAVVRGDAVVAEARKWIGTRFHHQGRVRGVGVDCVGLLIGVMRELGTFPKQTDITGYGRQPYGRTFQDHCESYMESILQTDASPGDVISISFGGHPMHLAILADHPNGGFSIIHALAQTRRCVEHRLDAVWAGRISGWHRLPGVG